MHPACVQLAANALNSPGRGWIMMAARPEFGSRKSADCPTGTADASPTAVPGGAVGAGPDTAAGRVGSGFVVGSERGVAFPADAMRPTAAVSPPDTRTPAPITAAVRALRRNV